MPVSDKVTTCSQSDMLSLIANDTRRRVLELIVEDEWDVGGLAKKVGLSQSALSQHLKRMRDVNVVEVRREAQTSFYSCKDAKVAKVLQTLKNIYNTPPKDTGAT